MLRQPSPAVHTVGYGDFSITYRLYFTVGSYGDVLPVRDAIITRIWYVARREGLQIPFPIAMEYRPNESPSPPPPSVDEILERFPRYRLVRQAMLAEAGGQPADAAAGPAAARVVTFARGEEMQPFGDTIPDFVLVAEGRATLLAADAEGRPVRIADLGPGDFYGEASISAGRPSEFRVVADTDVTTVAFDAARLAAHLQRSSGLAAEVGAALETRRRAAQALRRRRPATEPDGVD